MSATPRPRVRKDGSVAWVLAFRLEPGGPPTSETFESAEEAAIFGRLVDRVGGRAARAARNAMSRVGPEIPTLAEHLEDHLTRVAASATPGTVDDYRGLAKRTFLTVLGPLPVVAITEDSVAEWITWQRQQETVRSKQRRAKARAAGDPLPPVQTYSDKSIANAQRFLSSVMESAVARYGLPRNPAKGAALPTDKPKTEQVFLTPAEFQSLLAHVPDRWQPLVMLLYGTGMRWGEATALTPADFDLGDQPVVRINKAWKKAPRGGVYLGGPKGGRKRTVTLPVQVAEVVAPLVAETKRGALVFTGPRGGRVRSQNFHDRVWRPAVEAAGLGKQPRVHDLRHTHASLLIARGVPLTVIQRRLGHKSIQTTSDVYGHLTPELYAGAADAVPEIER